MSNEIMIASEVADLLRVDTQRIYELARTGKIPFIKVGDRQYRFARTALDQWLREGGNRNESESGSSDQPIKLIRS